MSQQFTSSDVHRIAKLANIPVDEQQARSLADGFTKTMAVIDRLNEIDVSNVEPIHQVTGLENITRDDELDEVRMFTQEQALANAVNHHEGFFVVDQIIDQEY
ncbi:MAG: Asp-tRNA(Asn)/Glu-tRNA(Gln) amidotransferase subunit GatC [Patescibacteria group bacterium]|nr:Asp-tRNA(Asn)/Glu-tRNA(Gln) amidotransferase subunit GatC [Patescibacteria group bacterium]